MSNGLTFPYNCNDGNNKKYGSHGNNSCNYANISPKMKKKTISMAKLKKIMKVYQSTSESLKIVLQIKRYIILTCKLLEKKMY